MTLATFSFFLLRQIWRTSDAYGKAIYALVGGRLEVWRADLHGIGLGMPLPQHLSLKVLGILEVRPQGCRPVVSL